MLNACQSAKERLYLELLTRVGARSEEIYAMRVDAVWDEKQNAPVSIIKIMCKGSKVREIPMWDSIRTTIEMYMKNERDRESNLLFPARRRPLVPDGNFLRKLLKNLAERLNMTFYTPHKFRTMVIKKLLDRGWSIEQSSKFIGHSDVSTTNKHYVAFEAEKIIAHGSKLRTDAGCKRI